MPVMMRYADAEQLLIDYLAPILAVPVGTKAASAPEFVRLFRTGGPVATPVSDRPLITFDAYAAKGSRAWVLADQTRAAVFALAGRKFGDVSVKEVTEAGGPANLPDPVFPTLTRYTLTLAVHLRGRQEITP
jgi:hypothetical protein